MLCEPQHLASYVVPVWRPEDSFQAYFSSSTVGPEDWTQGVEVGKQVTDS